MRYSLLSLALAAPFVLGACSDTSLSRLAPKLVITAYQDANTYYASVDDDNKVIDLGKVPLFATKYAVFKLDNPTGKALTVTKVTYSQTTGQRWDDPSVDPTPMADHFTSSTDLDFEIGPNQSAKLSVPYSPNVEGDASAVVSIESDAANGKVQSATIKALGVFTGAPSLQVEYNGYTGPAPTDCVDVDGNGQIDGCSIPLTNALDFGNIGLGAEGTARLILRNTAACTPFSGVSVCELCKITIDKDSTRDNVGLGFKDGTNAAGLFAFEGSTQVPFDVEQHDLNPDDACAAAGEIRFLLKFLAPTQDGEYHTTVAVESNDPARPLIEIPVVGRARNAPVAIAKFKLYNAQSPSDPYTDPTHIEPLGKVYFDGSASYDPSDPANTALIATYQWTVDSYPVGADPGMFQLSGQNSKFFNFWLPIAGHYVVKLTVWNTGGIQSGDTDQSRIEFDVIYGEGLNVELTWDNATNDQDLHLVLQNQDNRVCNIPWDCHWLNKTPVWFGGTAETGPNPWLDIDDTNGLGPEHVRIKTPQASTYRVYIHYFGDFNSGASSPTRETVKIFINGIESAEYRRTLTHEKDVWAVGDVVWNSDGTATIVPYPSDAAGEVGSVGNMQDCDTPGWTFP